LETNLRSVVWARLLLILALLLPLVILFLLPGGALVRGGPWFWLVLLLCISVIWGLLAPSPRAAERAPEPAFQVLPLAEEQPEVVREVMDVGLATQRAGVRTFQGRLREPAATSWRRRIRVMPYACTNRRLNGRLLRRRLAVWASRVLLALNFQVASAPASVPRPASVAAR